MGIARTVFTKEPLHAHKEQTTTRTLQRLMNFSAPDVLQKFIFKPCDRVWVFYRSTNKNEKVEWIRKTVVRVEDHSLIAHRSQKGRSMHVSYEDVCFAPRGDLTNGIFATLLRKLVISLKIRVLPRLSQPRDAPSTSPPDLPFQPHLFHSERAVLSVLLATPDRMRLGGGEKILAST